jgi:hypothetical protein
VNFTAFEQIACDLLQPRGVAVDGQDRRIAVQHNPVRRRPWAGRPALTSRTTPANRRWCVEPCVPDMMRATSASRRRAPPAAARWKIPARAAVPRFLDDAAAGM